MEFYELLDNYIKEIGCTAKQLAEKSDLSASVISRYRSGEREPSPDSDIVKKLANGISVLSDQNYDMILGQMISCLTSKSTFAKHAFYKIDRLVSELNIKQADIARAFNYDASFISRVLSGQRLPSNLDGFLKDISRYVAACVRSKERVEILSNLIFVSTPDLQTSDDRFHAVLNWLIYDDTPTLNFLNTLDNFEYKDFLTKLHFTDVKMPSEPLQLPATSTYIGKDQMKQGELDFMRVAAISRNSDDLFLYTDMSMHDMLDADFPRMYMAGLAILVKKGLHLNVIHNLNRPLDELLVGLETWVPLYMTGQISPYYFNGYADEFFSHLLYSAGTVSLYGSCLYDQREHGHYYLTKKKEEVAYFSSRASRMLEMSSPLMQIYRSSDKPALYKAITSCMSSSDNFKSILSSPPVASISKDLLENIVKSYAASNKLSKDKAAEIQAMVYKCIQNEKKLLQKQVKDKPLHVSFHKLTEEEFKESPVYLPLGISFMDINIPYTYETYTQHINEIHDYAKTHDNVIIEEIESLGFKNIQIRMGSGGESPWVLISKSLSPSIHFLINHPTLVNAISKI
ncbi:MAG: helix-turn-helix transcriptional regulator [Eubacterium sp.]|nr:helix-turn-helix transcriptional regulator [Eubacterium sp.]